MARMEIDRRAFFASVGGAAAVSLMAHEERAEALEHYMTDQLDAKAPLGVRQAPPSGPELQSPRGGVPDPDSA